MPQKLPVNDFKQVDDISEFDESFVRSCDRESDKVYFLEFDIQYVENLYNLHNDLPLLPKRLKIKN